MPATLQFTHKNAPVVLPYYCGKIIGPFCETDLAIYDQFGSFQRNGKRASPIAQAIGIPIATQHPVRPDLRIRNLEVEGLLRCRNARQKAGQTTQYGWYFGHGLLDVGL
jgi:hypothetical protein